MNDTFILFVNNINFLYVNTVIFTTNIDVGI